MSSVRLSETSYAMLGLVEMLEPTTPYQLERVAEVCIFPFWSLTHTQVYTECERLAKAGLLSERREESGRRRRVFRLAAAGRAALEQWRDDPETERNELRDAALLKLFCGGDPAAIAEVQAERHRQRLATYREMAGRVDMTDGMRLALEAGIGHEQEYVRFWSRLCEGADEQRATETSRRVARR